MKRQFFIIFLLFFAIEAKAGNTYTYLNKRGEYVYPKSQQSVRNDIQAAKLNYTKGTLNYLAKIKFEIINGNLSRAKQMLQNIDDIKEFARPIQYRYLAIIEFLNGNYAQSLDYTRKPQMQHNLYRKRVCLLEVMNLLVMSRSTEAKEVWSKCLELILPDSPSALVWPQTLVNLQNGDPTVAANLPFQDLAIENEQGDLLRLYLKLALYLNKTDIVLERLQYFSPDIYQNDEIRELLGMIYYRNGQIVKAYSFLEDLDSPNAEAVKGNLFLAQKKYELAYAQFKLVLKRKSNSLNALERLLPIAWMLRQWDEGYQFAKKIEVAQERKIEKNLLIAAFLTMAEKYSEAKEIVNALIINGHNSQGPAVNHIYSIINFELNDKQLAQTYAYKACEQLEGVHCWLLYQLHLWEDFTLTAKRDDKIEIGESLVSQYSSTKKEEAIDEKVFIDQKDIEELDDALIDLLPDVKDSLTQR